MKTKYALLFPIAVAACNPSPAVAASEQMSLTETCFVCLGLCVILISVAFKLWFVSSKRG